MKKSDKILETLETIVKKLDRIETHLGIEPEVVPYVYPGGVIPPPGPPKE